MTVKKTELDLGRYEPTLISHGVGVWRYGKKLPLRTDDGHLRIIFFGVGSAFAEKMFQSNFAVIKGDTVVWVDAGTKLTHKIAEFGLGVLDIKHMILTHGHADHIGSAEELALKGRYMAPFVNVVKEEGEEFGPYMKRVAAARESGMFRPAIYVPQEFSKILWDQSLRGGLARSEVVHGDEPTGSEMQLSHFFRVVSPRKTHDHSVDTWEIEIGGIHFQMHLTNHIPDAAKNTDESLYSVGMVIDRRVFISGDTKYCPETIHEFGTNCELLLHDCQSFPGGVHAPYKDLCGLSAEIKAKMLLYHLDDGMLRIGNEGAKKDGFAGFAEPAPIVYDL